jgi:adenylate cyclase
MALRIRDALRRVQDIVADATGQRLEGQAEERLLALLGNLAGSAPRNGSAREHFSYRDVTILLADLRGFMAMTASQPAGAVLELLNQYFSRMSEIIMGHHGVIDKFMGDAVMAIFAGVPGVPGEDARRALHCAVDMQIALEGLNSERKGGTLPPLYLGIGINTGRVLAGLVGSELYSAYTVIGEEVNVASRIESFSLRGQVLLTQATYEHCGDFVSAGESMDVYVKGKSERVRVRELLALPSLGKTLPRQEIRRSPRVAVTLSFGYHLVQNKIVKPAGLRGRVLDIGYYGVLAEVEQELPLRAELKLDLELPLVEHRASDVYARVVTAAPSGDRYQVGLEFTSLSPESNSKLRLFLQMLIQGQETQEIGT